MRWMPSSFMRPRLQMFRNRPPGYQVGSNQTPQAGGMRMRGRIALMSLVLVLFAMPASAFAAEQGEHSPNMSYVKNLEYEAREGESPNYGTDIEFATLDGRKYALAGSYHNGLQIVDITRPERAQIASEYDCNVTQGDVQVFRQADEPGRTFATYTSDTYGDGTSTCYQEAAALGFDAVGDDGA